MANDQGPSPLVGPRRTALAQDRSKQTRRRLVRAAVRLWTERGFDEGVETTTVDEIAQAAGVTKGTFYFHFAHKEDIFLELGWGTADALYNEAVQGSTGRRSGLALVRQLLVLLSRRVEAVPPPAVLRSVSAFRSAKTSDMRAGGGPGRRGIHQAVEVALDVAVAQGELPQGSDTEELARMITALVMDALLDWAQGGDQRLRSVLRRRADVILAGAGDTAGTRPRAYAR